MVNNTAFSRHVILKSDVPSTTILGTLLWLSSEVMFFGAVFTIYFVHRSSVGDEIWYQFGSHLNTKYAFINTLILIASSITSQISIFSIEKGRLQKYRFYTYVTIFLGLLFVSGQINEYISLINDGVIISKNSWNSIFYLSTGIHGLHVIFGIIAFILLMVRHKNLQDDNYTFTNQIQAMVVSYYWHFVDVIWIMLFLVIYILR